MASSYTFGDTQTQNLKHVQSFKPSNFGSKMGFAQNNVVMSLSLTMSMVDSWHSYEMLAWKCKHD